MSKNKLLLFLGIAIVICAVIILLQSQDEGYVKVEGKDVRLLLAGAWGRSVSATSGNEAVKASTGIYRPKSIEITAEKDGQSYTIKSGGPWGELSKVEIRKDETTVIKCGPPLKAKADVRRSGREVSLGLSIIGSAGEVYGPRTLRSVPGVKIIDEKDNLLSEGKFAFG